MDDERVWVTAVLAEFQTLAKSCYTRISVARREVRCSSRVRFVLPWWVCWVWFLLAARLRRSRSSRLPFFWFYPSRLAHSLVPTPRGFPRPQRLFCVSQLLRRR